MIKFTYLNRIFLTIVINYNFDLTGIRVKPLATLQKKLIRLVCNVPPRTHTAPLMQQLTILNIYNLYKYRTAIEVHKFKYPKKELNRPQHNHTYTAVTQVHTHNTRHARSGSHYIPRQNKPQAAISSSTYTTERNNKIWNSIPQGIRTEKNLKHFKSAPQPPPSAAEPINSTEPKANQHRFPPSLGDKTWQAIGYCHTPSY